MTKGLALFAGLLAALKQIFVTPQWNEQVFEILDNAIMSKNNHTGRPGMDLWQIFVLAQVRLCKNMSYDDLHYAANTNKIIRQLIGIDSDVGFGKEHFGYQIIKNIVDLFTDNEGLWKTSQRTGTEAFSRVDGSSRRMYQNGISTNIADKFASTTIGKLYK